MLKRPLGIGARVKLKFGGHEVRAIIVEDRGGLGVAGARLVRVRLDPPPEAAGPVEFEVRAADVLAA